MTKVYIDGGCEHNPGVISAAAVFFDNKNNMLLEKSQLMEYGTTNEAEYYGLLLALRTASFELKIKELQVFSDSKLVVCQINGEWKVKHENMKPLYKKAKYLIDMYFTNFNIKHIPREKNKHSDSIATKAIKRYKRIKRIYKKFDFKNQELERIETPIYTLFENGVLHKYDIEIINKLFKEDLKKHINITKYPDFDNFAIDKSEKGYILSIIEFISDLMSEIDDYYNC